MAAYLLVEIEIEDPAGYDDYIARVPAVVYEHGGRYLSRGNDVVPLAGGWDPDRMILIEFPDLDALGAFATSPSYQELAPLREASTKTRSVALPGVESQPGA